MFVVQIKGKFSKKNEEYFLNTQGRKTAYLGQAQHFESEEMAQRHGIVFTATYLGTTFSVERM